MRLRRARASLDDLSTDPSSPAEGEPAEPPVEEESPLAPAQMPAELPASTGAKTSDIQLWIVGGIGIVSLLMMFMVRNVESLRATLETESGIATLSQLRDFAAGSVGYLVGTTKNR